MKVTSMKLADRLHRIAPFHVMDLLAKAKQLQAQGRDVIHLEVGEPDFATPEPIVQAGIEALQTGKTHYTAATGLPELKRAIADFYAQRYAQTVNPEHIVITPGASGALQLVTALLANPNEKLLLADPGYPCNRHFMALINAHGHMVPTTAQQGFQLTPSLIEQHWDEHTLGALVASPTNPTGAVMNAQELDALYQAVKQRHGILVVDEIYHGLTYGHDAPSAVDKVQQGDAFVINSFSKYFGMTGWRLGWIVAPEWAVPALDKLAQNLFLAPPTPAQYAALAAFKAETLSILEARREEFARRRAYLLPALKQLGFQVPVEPSGAFYIYCDVSAFTQDSMQFCLDLLEQQGVAITPGIDFSEQTGHYRGEHFVRLAYTTDVPRLQEAVARIQTFLHSLKNNGPL